MATEQIVVRSWRDEERDDRLARAQIARERAAGRIADKIAEQQAKAAVRLQAAEARELARQRARNVRAARRAARMAWVNGHVVDLLFIPVILVPGVLAWTGMAAYGAAEYGPPGLALPALSEGGMWTFAAATTLRRHEDDKARELDPDAEPRPLWHMRLGTLIFAAYGAALNFLHGLTEGGPVTGAAMALVSVAGVTAHQLITAGPRRSRADRDRARIARLITRRENTASRAAVRHAPVQLDEHGTARLILESGMARLSTHHGRAVLTMTRPAAQTVQPLLDVELPPAQPVQPLMRGPLGFLLRWSPAWPSAQVEQPPSDPSMIRETPNSHRGNVDNPGDDDPAQTEHPEQDTPEPPDTHRADPPAPPALSDTDRAAAERWLEIQDREGDDEYTRALKAARRSALAENPLSGRQLDQRYQITRTEKEQIVAIVRDETGGGTTP